MKSNGDDSIDMVEINKKFNTEVIENMNKNLPSKLKKSLHKKKLHLARIWLIAYTIVICLFENSNHFISKNQLPYNIRIINWAFDVISFITILISFKKINVIHFGLMIVLVRCKFRMFNQSQIQKS